MTRCIVVGLGLLLLAGSVQGANVDTNAGTDALLFSVDDFSLSSFNGGFGLRHYLKDGLALRPGIDFGLGSSKDEHHGSPREIESRTATIGASLALEKHLGAPGSLSPYIGIESEYRWSKSIQELDDNLDTPGWTTKDESSRSEVVFSGLLGFEWGFTERLTLGGEYQLYVRYSSSSRESERADPPRTIETEQTSLSSGLNAASIYLSVGL
jgi:opacity protein-like surface antigen